MAKIKKRGASGQAKNYITRTQAVRKLQISLPDFRRLCIFKGIYPREPRNKKRASKSSTPSTTFYYTKDIQYLLHEPLLASFRNHKALSKKIARSLGRGEVGNAVRLEKTGSQRISLDHIIKERYPTFLDALRDLDDALSLLFLFASLPSTAKIPPKTIHLCQRLCHEFQHYIILSHSLRKSFLSIKGIYYQATIQGQDIMWLVPYRFVQRVTGDVDFRIMGTFIEFYTTLLGFVNFRLYSSIGFVYPPRFNAKSDEYGGELGAFTLEAISIGETNSVGADARLLGQEAKGGLADRKHSAGSSSQLMPDEHTKLEDRSRDTDEHVESVGQVQANTATIDHFEVTGDGADILPQPSLGTTEVSKLFSETHFFLSRETPRQPLEFILKSFGCRRVSWPDVIGEGAFTSNEHDISITHHVVDRPSTSRVNAAGTEPLEKVSKSHIIPGRTYIQPQWVWDCINAGELLRPDLYAPGSLLPPHLSPWVKAKPGSYDPTVSLDEQAPDGEAEDFTLDESHLLVDISEITTLDKAEVRTDDGEVGSSQNVIEAYSVHVPSQEGFSEELGLENDFGGFEEDHNTIDRADDDFRARQAKVEAEASRQSKSSASTQDRPLDFSGNELTAAVPQEARQRRRQEKRQAQEDIERRLGMMSRKKRKLYEKMMHGKEKQDEEAKTLRRKKWRLQAKGREQAGG